MLGVYPEVLYVAAWGLLAVAAVALFWALLSDDPDGADYGDDD